MGFTKFVGQSIKFGEAIVKHAANGFSQVSDEVYEKRLNICRSCEHFDAQLTKCNHCGCLLNIKARWPTEACPIKKWLAETPGRFTKIPQEVLSDPNRQFVFWSGNCNCSNSQK